MNIMNIAINSPLSVIKAIDDVLSLMIINLYWYSIVPHIYYTNYCTNIIDCNK